MKVQLIAETAIHTVELADLGYTVHPGDEESADELAEFAGRVCYQSFNRPNPASLSNEAYLGHVLDSGDDSVFAHGSASFYVETSRSVLSELEQHRDLHLSVLSQRRVDPVPFGVQIPPAIERLPEDQRQRAFAILRESQDAAVQAYDQLLDVFHDLPRKQAREAARAVLPSMTTTPLVVTANHRSWRGFIKARWHEAADAEIRELAGELLTQLREIATNTYQDVPHVPYSNGG